MYTTLKWLLYEKKSEAFAVANRMVVEAMEKRYEQDLQKWNSTPIEKKTKKNKPVKVEFGVRICQKDCKYYVGLLVDIGKFLP